VVGRILGGRYQVEEKLGGGGMALVYRGKDLLLNRTVTIKVLREQYAHDQEFIRRFRREAQAVASLSHPHIVSIYDVGREEDLHYLVMEYVEGKTLKDLIVEAAPMPMELAVHITQQICEALEHAHQHRIIHRDIKPQNILITKDGRVKVTDFGIALATTGATLTYDSSVIGTAHYLSPEQAKGEVLSNQSDVYSIGVVLYEMLSGQTPFTGDSPIGVAVKHLQEKPRPLRELKPKVPAALARVVTKAMAKDREERYGSARQMWTDLEKVRLGLDLEELEDEQMAANGKHRRNNRRRLRPLGTVLIAALAVLMGYGLWMLLDSWLVVGETRVPMLVGETETRAQQMLEGAGLKMRVDERRFHPTIPEGSVVSQSEEPNKVIKKGRIVGVDISLGPEMRLLPDVTGDPERVARLRLTNEGFAVDPNVEMVNHPDIPEGRVVSQDPAGDTRQPKGTMVRLTISAGPPAQLVPMPNLIGLSMEEARVVLEEARLVPEDITYTDSNLYFSGQVSGQSVPAGEPIMQGSGVRLVVSKGPGPLAQGAVVKMTVPADGREHEVRIVVVDAKGTHEEYRRTHPPGENLSVRVPYFGTGKVQVYLDGQLYYEYSLP